MRERLELRAQEPVARCLIRRLVVPRIYFDAAWPGLPGEPTDVLAIDRDGVGDAHIVQVRRAASEALLLVPGLLKAAAPYRWIAFLRGSEDEPTILAFSKQDALYAAETGGRVGLLEFFEMPGGDIGASVRLAAERFPDTVHDMSVSFSETFKASIQFGA